MRIGRIVAGIDFSVPTIAGVNCVAVLGRTASAVLHGAACPVLLVTESRNIVVGST
jgi:hypothetical protein